MSPWPVLLIVGAGVLVSSGPAGAMAQPSPGGSAHALTEPAGTEATAVGLLGAAVAAARSRSYTGTQYLATYRQGKASSGLVTVRHVPGLGLDVATDATAADNGEDIAQTLRNDVLDEQLVALLATNYTLSVTGQDGCAGRSAHVVEVRRPAAGEALAGRFWLDRDSGLVLRREVYDERGRTVRSSAYVDLQVSGQPVAIRQVATTPGAQLDPASLPADWPRVLPGAFELVEARQTGAEADGRDADVIHLAYSDGLSTLSLFAQDGRLAGPPDVGFLEEQVQGRAVWVRGSSPERVVWSGGGRTWTLLSDAPPGSVRTVVASLPYDEQPAGDLLTRVVRGAARVGSWLNPFS